MFRLMKYLWMMPPFVGWFTKKETKAPEETFQKPIVSTKPKAKKKPKSPSKKAPVKKQSSATTIPPKKRGPG